MQRAPGEIELRFLASLDPDEAELEVTGPDGGSVVAGAPVFDGAQVTIPVAATLAGEYEIAYGVLSNDGHFVDGTVEFTVTEGEQPGPAVTPSPTVGAAPSPSSATDRASADPGPPTVSNQASAGSGGLLWLVGAVVLALLVGAGYGGWRWRRRSAAG